MKRVRGEWRKPFSSSEEGFHNGFGVVDGCGENVPDVAPSGLCDSEAEEGLYVRVEVCEFVIVNSAREIECNCFPKRIEVFSQPKTKSDIPRLVAI